MAYGCRERIDKLYKFEMEASSWLNLKYLKDRYGFACKEHTQYYGSWRGKAHQAGHA